MIKPALTSLMAAALLVARPPAARAEDPTPPRLVATTAQLRATAKLRPGLRLSSPFATQTTLTVDLPKKGQQRTGAVLMIVGAAGIVTGLLVDEPIVTIAGAGVGGYGLYLYLK
jgi:hypothetical protein